MINAFADRLELKGFFSAAPRFDFEDEKVKELAHLIHESFRVIDMTGGILNLYPWIRHIAPDLSGFKPLMNTHVPLWTFLKVRNS